MDVKEKLTELINDVLSYLPWGEISSHTASECADYLIANGVTVADGKDTDVPANCKDCLHRDACLAWIRHGEAMHEDFGYSVEDCPWFEDAVKGVEINPVNKWIPVTERLPDVERLIAHWQSKADELKKSVEDTCGEASTVSTYKWMHSLWRTVCEFVADLDDLATHCEINNYVENCEECGFCKKGE